MALDIRLPPYILESVIVRDSYLTHYTATGVGRAQYIATEFYPTYMADRAPNGSLKISDRFFKEFEGELENFKKRAEKMNTIGGAILPIEGVVENNNTAYVVRRVCSFTHVENYMNGQKMPFMEAFQFVRPLMLSLSKAQSNGVIFNFSVKDFRVTPQRQLMLDATFAWDMNFHPSLIELAKLYFKLITGNTYSPERPSAADYDVTIPARLEEILQNALSGEDILYGSLDDFYKRIKQVIDQESGSGTSANTTASTRAMNIAAVVLFILIGAAMVGLAYGGVVAYRASSSWVHTEFADASIGVPNFDFTQVAITHPRNTADTLGGSFLFHDIFVFSRSDWGRPVMVRRAVAERALQFAGGDSDEETIFLDNVIPSFMNTWTRMQDDRAVRTYIFFADGMYGNTIFRARTTGLDRELTQINVQTSMHLVIIGDELFYANYNHNNFLHSIELNTMETRVSLAMPIFGTATDGQYLYFLSGEAGSPLGVYRLHPSNPIAVRRLASNAGKNIHFDTGSNRLFYSDTDGHVRALSPEGELLQVWEDMNVHTFTVDGNFLIFTEHGHLNPRVIDMNWNERFTLDANYRLAYIWARGGVLYGIDHVYPAVTRTLYLP